MPTPLTKTSPLLITGAGGFIGKNLTARLRALGYENLLPVTRGTPPEELAAHAARAAFVFHLAGVNRPEDPTEFYAGNSGFTATLVEALKQNETPPPVLATSSAQVGNGTDYAKSKAGAEETLLAYGEETGAPVYLYRLPGVFGKWSRPNYNTVVATFCHNIARGLPVEVRDPDHQLALVYIDDVVDAFLAVLDGPPAPDPAAPGLCAVQPVFRVTLGALAALLEGFRESRKTLAAPPVGDAFGRALYATWLSFLPEDGFAYPLKMNTDDRGSFTEFLRSPEAGQMSVNVAKPGITKGNHWHDTKNEKFLVVSGEGVIRFRRVGEDEIIEYPVSGDRLTVVDIPTGTTHNIENTGAADLVTLMWASEPFDPEHPDTYFEKV